MEWENVCQALVQKKEWFARYEACTEQMLQCDADSIENYITERARFANEIDGLDQAILDMCAGSQAQLLQAALRNSCDYAALPAQMQPVFLRAQEVLGHVNRIAQLDQAVLCRMETLLQEYRQQITRVQHAPKIARYLTGLQAPAAETNMLGARYEKV